MNAKEIIKGIDKTIRTVRRKLGFGDRIKFVCEVSISQEGRQIARGFNHVVNNGLISLINNFIPGTNNAAVNPLFLNGFPNGTYSTMVLGTDTTHPTVAATSALSAPIGLGIGTSPNSGTAVLSNPSGGSYRATITGTWNAGAVTGTIGEVGLYGWLETTLSLNTFSQALFSRLSVADGSFTAVAINTSLALTVTWTITISYA